MMYFLQQEYLKTAPKGESLTDPEPKIVVLRRKVSSDSGIESDLTPIDEPVNTKLQKDEPENTKLQEDEPENTKLQKDSK